MGFMDRMKQGMDAAKEAQQMAASGTFAAAGAPTGEDVAEVQKLTKLNNSGVEKKATVKSLTPTGKQNPGGGEQHAITVDVEDGYEATFTQYLVGMQMESLVPGNEIIVRVDPDDAQSMIFWSTPQ